MKKSKRFIVYLVTIAILSLTFASLSMTVRGEELSTYLAVGNDCSAFTGEKILYNDSPGELVSGISPDGDAFRFTVKPGQIHFSVNPAVDQDKFDNADAIVFWIKTPDVPYASMFLEVADKDNPDVERYFYHVGDGVKSIKTVAKDGTVNNIVSGAGSYYCPLSGNFEGYVIIPVANFANAGEGTGNDTFEPGKISRIRFRFEDGPIKDKDIYVDSFGVTTNIDKAIPVLKEKMNPGSVSQEDDIIAVGNDCSAFTGEKILYNDSPGELVSGVSPDGDAFRFTVKPGEIHFSVNPAVDQDKFDNADAIVFWIKTPDVPYASMFLEVADKDNPDVERYFYHVGDGVKSIKTVAKDGTVNNIVSGAGSYYCPLSGNFEGYVIIPVANFANAGEGTGNDTFEPGKISRIRFRFEDGPIKDKDIYVDSFGVTTNIDLAIPLLKEKLAKPTEEVTLTKSGDNFTVAIKGWKSTNKYQIWTYQKTQSEIFGGEGLTNQWVLSHPYTLGSDRGANGFTVDGDAITRNIGPFNSVDRNYTVAVKVIDGAGNFVGQYKDTFTQAEAGEVVINKVTVDGQFADDKAFVKDIANDSPVAFVVTGNGVAGTVYTAKVDQTGDQLVASGAGLNEFSWDISLMQPGNYSVTLTASTADSSDSRTVNINLYKNDPAVVYGEMTELVVTGAAENDNFKIDINPTVTGGKFRYRISEPWRGTIPGGDSELVEIPAAPLSNTAIPKTAYGVYEVQTFTYRDGVSSADDGAVRTVTNARPGEPVTLNVTVDGNPAGAEMITKAKGTAIVFTPEATGLPLPQYSFWRRDANGWVLIRDYSGEGLTWTPNRVGLYTIQVRAKATGGLTYEVLKNIEFNINEVGGDKIADVANITINQAALDTNAKARTPILITANATSAEQDLLYKFIISNGYIYYVETAYSADPTYMWVPGKAGNYTISVLVKNQASFGKYDAVETFTVTVQ